MNIRTAAEDDLPAIVEIYNQAIALRYATADLTLVTVDSRRGWLAAHKPDEYPLFVAENAGAITGWCSLSAYRPGRMALRHTAEISYYVHQEHWRSGVATGLITHAIDQCPRLQLKTLFAILLDVNPASANILARHGFTQWGHLPGVAEIDGRECGHLYYGLRAVP